MTSLSPCWNCPFFSSLTIAVQGPLLSAHHLCLIAPFKEMLGSAVSEDQP